MAKLHYYPKKIANMLKQLWFVSAWFTPSEYETFVEASYWYFAHVKGATLSHVELYAFRSLACLVRKYEDKLRNLCVFQEDYKNFYC